MLQILDYLLQWLISYRSLRFSYYCPYISLLSLLTVASLGSTHGFEPERTFDPLQLFSFDVQSSTRRGVPCHLRLCGGKVNPILPFPAPFQYPVSNHDFLTSAPNLIGPMENCS